MNGFMVSVFLILISLFHGYLAAEGLKIIKAGWILWGLGIISFAFIIMGAGLYLRAEYLEIMKKNN